MPSWIFTHIDPLPDMVISCRSDYSNLKVSLLPDETEPVKNTNIFHQESKVEYFDSLNSKKGLLLKNQETGEFTLRLKGLFRKKLIIEYEETEYSGMKIS
ncbi:MAG: hypothetical protein JXR53_07045 [Bacteroidales bacterium]|nr:hypothetical protein [Bacteroidales bacterium]